MRTLLILTSLLVGLSCSPVKRVLRSLEKTRQVVDFYLQKYPISNDTITKITAGDTIIEMHQQIDTIYTSYRDTLIKTLYVTNTITRKVIDTFKITVTDKKMLKELQDANTMLKIQLEESQKDNQEIKSSKTKWMIGALATWIILLLLLIGYIARSFRPSVKTN